MLVLSIGTTLNIGMLVFVALPATWRLHLRWRPTLKFPPGVLRRASGLALVGLLEFVAADMYSVITIDLANGHGTTGALVLVQLREPGVHRGGLRAADRDRDRRLPRAGRHRR